VLRAKFIRWLGHEALERLRYQWALFKLLRSRGVVLEGDVEIWGIDNLRVESGAAIGSGVLLNCGGMPWCDYGGGIAVGAGSYVGPHCVLFGAGGIEIGRDVLIAPSVVIASHQHTFADHRSPIGSQPMDFAMVTIEDDVWIGSGAVVLPGVTIGRGSVIGAGAVVSRSIPPGSVAMGVPARVVRRRDQNERRTEASVECSRSVV
jgi:acetyltransferase-like isoleucine patch superfamily enzyme